MLLLSYRYRRVLGYIMGFVLFYAPFALFQRTILFLLGYTYNPTIHTLCFRIPIEHIFSNRFFSMGEVAVLGTIILFLVAFFFGPLFCGRLCPTGAITEYVSLLIPSRFKINWGKYIPIAPLRYGFLLGFLISPLIGGYLACSYCNYFVFDLLLNYCLWGYTVAFSSSLLLTLILWFVVFGLFTQGGRGFCNFFCPVGAIQNLLYFFGCKTTLAWKLQIVDKRCILCKQCVHHCPMLALNFMEKQIKRNQHHCILCMQCMNNCPVQAIYYSKTTEMRNKDEQ